jgi:hypothetical protein
MWLGFNEQTEVQDIQSKLAEFLPTPEARELTMRIYQLALDVDNEINTLLRDPPVQKLYQFDGQFFTPRGRSGFQTAFDGLHISRSLADFIGIFFRGRTSRSAIRWLLDELNKHRWAAQRRRMNWEEFGTLDVLPKERIEAIIGSHEAGPDTPLPLSAEEKLSSKSSRNSLRRHSVELLRVDSAPA